LPLTHEGRRFRRSGLRELSECPEGRVAVTSGCESFFRKLRKGRRQLDFAPNSRGPTFPTFRAS
ncbi:hypothetical protein PIB30_113898, partial [Stylosanthes scabra]|nr:hypothetical protein [Stylosanthes scabra]